MPELEVSTRPAPHPPAPGGLALLPSPGAGNSKAEGAGLARETRRAWLGAPGEVCQAPPAFEKSRAERTPEEAAVSRGIPRRGAEGGLPRETALAAPRAPRQTNFGGLEGGQSPPSRTRMSEERS